MEEKDQFKYVTCSFKYMLESFHKLGIGNVEIDVSLYGGANILDLQKTVARIGDKNIEMAKELIRKNNLKVKNEDIGGTYSRTITHYSSTGITNLKINPKKTTLKEGGQKI